MFIDGLFVFIKQPGAALNIDVLSFHGFHDEIFLFFLRWNEAFHLAGNESSTCHRQEFGFAHGFQVHSFIGGSSWIAVDRKWKGSEQVVELIDHRSF